MRSCYFPCLLFLLLSRFSESQAADDGLFAIIETTKGTIRAQLEYEKVPTVVANFVGLIEGTQTSLDLLSGALNESSGFYDDMIFHRMIDDFMIQTGSPNRRGTDGPGYVFQDEFHPSLTHEPFVLSMANSGPNSNGSQFFIPVKETPWLNNVHSVFGEIVEGTDVVTAISKVATDQGDRPVEEVTLKSIKIERIGAAAEAFSVESVQLPVVRHLKSTWRRTDGLFRLESKFQPNSDVQLYASPNLQEWTSERIAFFGDDEATPDLPVDVSDVVTGRRTNFFRIAEIAYPTVVFPPPFVIGKTLETSITRFGSSPTSSSLLYQFNTPTTGKATFTSNAAVDISTFLYRIDSPTKATLIVPSDLIAPLNLTQFSLNFTSGSTGTFTAVLPRAFPAPITMAGTFLLNETP